MAGSKKMEKSSITIKDKDNIDDNVIFSEEDSSNAMLWGCILGFVLFLIILLAVVIFVR